MNLHHPSIHAEFYGVRLLGGHNTRRLCAIFSLCCITSPDPPRDACAGAQKAAAAALASLGAHTKVQEALRQGGALPQLLELVHDDPVRTHKHCLSRLFLRWQSVDMSALVLVQLNLRHAAVQRCKSRES